MRPVQALSIVAALACSVGIAHAAPVSDDPYLWLEDVSSPRAMQWVEAHNAKSTAVLEADPRYPQFYSQALAIAEAKDRIPVGYFLGGQVYNFWQDADHVRGIWRRSSVASYASGQPSWETVLDLDALADSEKANWVWKGASCARPAERHCLLYLSDGGEDAVTVREFDRHDKGFVSTGFNLPKGKQDVSWENENSLLVSREWKPGELTESGYAYVVKRLKRGQKLSAATELFRGNKKDVAASAGVLRDAANRTLPFVSEATDFFNSKTFLLTPKGTQGVAIPDKAQFVDMLEGRVIIQSREDWTPTAGGKTFPAGSLLSVDLAQLRANPRHLKPTLIYAPGPREAVSRALFSLAASRELGGRTCTRSPVSCQRLESCRPIPTPRGAAR